MFITILAVFISLSVQMEIKVPFSKKVISIGKKPLVEEFVIGPENNEVHLIPGNFNSESPTEKIIGTMDRNDPDFVHKMSYGTPSKYLEGFGHFFKHANLVEGASKANILNVLYAVERYYSLHIYDKEGITNPKECEKATKNHSIILEKVNERVKESLDTEEHAVFKDFKSLRELYHLKWDIRVIWSMYLSEEVVAKMRGSILYQVFGIKRCLGLEDF